MYKVILKKTADKYLKLMDRAIQVKIIDKLKLLQKWEFKTLKVTKLEWYENLYKFRIWKYRVIFEKYDENLVILIIKIGSRWDVYK